MNITENLIRISKAKDDIKQSLRNKGIPVPDDALLDEYSTLIDNVELYGPLYNDLYNMRTINGTNMVGLYAYCIVPELDLSILDTSKATDMRCMFSNCSSSINIDGWDTSKVTNMYNMFQYFSGSIDISKLDFSSATNVGNMFNQTNTDNIILTGLSFPGTTKLDNMFSSAKGTAIDLSSWDISNITNMYNMFYNAEYKRINLTGWKTTNVTDMSSMFYNYSNPLEELIIPDWDMTNTTGYSNFYYVNNSSYKNTLRLIDLSRSNDTTITKIASFLPTRTTTTYGDVIVPSNTSQATFDTLIAKYWRPIGADLSPDPTSAEIISEFDDIRPGKSTRVCIGAWEPWYADPSKVEIIMVSDESIATMDGDRITSKGIIGDILLEARVIDTQEIVATKTITVSEEDLSPNVIKFRASYIYTGTYAAILTVNNTEIKSSKALVYDKYLDIYSYDAGVPITSIKFGADSYCKLTEIVKLNTSNLTRVSSLFSGQKFTQIDMSDWNTSNITHMDGMFAVNSQLISLDLSNFNTSNVITIQQMFMSCSSLRDLDLSNFDMTNVTYVSEMFYKCTSLQELRLDNCNTDTINKIITSMNFPTNVIEGQVRTIYCKEENAAGLTPPTNWVFSFID